MRTVREVAELAGVTVRALHHYDEIGLLKPSGRSESGYRLYSHGDLLRLREIVAWRRLGFSLREVQELVDESDRDRAAALGRRRTLAQEQLARAAALVDALDVALAAHHSPQLLEEETMFEGFSSMAPLVVVDAAGRELGRCCIESGAAFERGRSVDLSVDLGPLGCFRVVDVRAGDPLVLVAERAERERFAYEIVVRKDGIEDRRGLLPECSASLGDRLKWPRERGEHPVDHEVVEVRAASDDRRSVVVIERVV